MLQTTGDNDLGAQVSGKKQNQDVIAGAGCAAGDGGAGWTIENLSTVAKSAKSKKSKLTKLKKSGL